MDRCGIRSPQRLLFTVEAGSTGGAYQANLDYPSATEDLFGIMGRGRFECIQGDRQGNSIILEEAGGSNGTQYPNAKQPNSFIYRFVPVSSYDVKQGGRLQVLQVTGESATPMTFHQGQADLDIASPDMKALHTYGM